MLCRGRILKIKLELINFTIPKLSLIYFCTSEMSREPHLKISHNTLKKIELGTTKVSSPEKLPQIKK